jgi:hypothetical protein
MMEIKRTRCSENSVEENMVVVSQTARKNDHEYPRPKKAIQGSSDLTTAGYSMNGRVSDWPLPICACATH